MLEGLYIASSGGVKQQRKLEVLSNNLANLNTPGFKKDQLVFEELVPPFKEARPFETARNTLLPPGIASNDVSYVGIAGQTTNFQQGTLTKTENQFDLALEGEGFFAVQTSQGIRYSRSGSFQLDPQRRLTTKNGDPILALGNQPIALPVGIPGFTVDEDGLITLGTGTDLQPAGQLNIVRFENPSDLRKEGNGLYAPINPNTQPVQAQDTRLIQGFIENSNVSAVEEMTKMIETVRTFEAYQKIIQSVDEANNQAVNSIARLA